MAADAIDLDAIDAARRAGRSVVRRTPVVSSSALSDVAGHRVALKVESLQRTGAFKIRGAINKLAMLGADARHGVTAGSAGNHAQALALAADEHGVRCEIFVPTGAPVSKIAACEGYGAVVHEVGDTVEDAVVASRRRAESGGLVFCHPFDDAAVIAGQGTLGLELFDDIEQLDTVVVPVGGGGLASGVAIALKTRRSDLRVIGVQAERCAPYTGRPPAANGSVATLADGIAVKSPGALTGPLVERWLDEIVTVDEDTIADAMVLLLQRSKLLVEGAGAVGVAALLAGRIASRGAGVTCVVLTGGNVDLGVVPGIIRRHETQAGRRLIVFARVDDRPGGLVRLLDAFAGAGANVIEVQHVREGLDLSVRESGLRASLEVRGPDHAAAVLAAGRAAGFALRVEHLRPPP